MSRDPARIEPTLEAIRVFWERHPDWRLGQVIVNAVPFDRLFFIEDRPLVDAIEGLEDLLLKKTERPDLPDLS